MLSPMRNLLAALALVLAAAPGCGGIRSTDFRVTIATWGSGAGDTIVRSCKADSVSALLEAGPSPDRSGLVRTITADWPGAGARSSGVRCSAGGIAQVGYNVDTGWFSREGWTEADLAGLWFGVERPSSGPGALQEFAVEVRDGRAWLRRLLRDGEPRLGEPAGTLERISRPDARRDLWEVRLPLLPWGGP